MIDGGEGLVVMVDGGGFFCICVNYEVWIVDKVDNGYVKCFGKIGEVVGF